MQGIGVEPDRKRALKLYQTAVRAEGQLNGESAEIGDATVEKLIAARDKMNAEKARIEDTKAAT